jgi:SAM-dependent methyltransferase
MDHRDHVTLIRDGIAGARAGPWADVGAGTGAFTLALADLLGPGGEIVALDRDEGALRACARRVSRAFPATRMRTVVADLELPPELPPLAGIVIANALHFVPPDRQVATVRALAGLLVPGGRFVLVEYDADRGNRWVPHPFSAARWAGMAARAGLREPRAVGRVPSRFLGAIYASVAMAP